MPVRPPSRRQVDARLDRLASSMHDDPLLSAVAARGGDVFLVGGSVRDLLLGEPSNDYDFTMARGALHLAREVADACGGSFVPLKESRGMARVVLGDAYVDFADFQAATLEDDLRARDLTINAMAIHLPSLARAKPALIDPCGGIEDLCHGVLRCPSHSVLDEDPLRILRVVRFACKLGFAVDAGTRNALAPRVPLLSRVAGERIRDELFSILGTELAFDGVRMLDASGALGALLPELEKGRGLAQGDFHHLDVFDHSMQAMRCLHEEVIPSACGLLDDPRPLLALLERELAGGRRALQCLKLAALLHDVGKPDARHFKENERVSFEGHEKVGAGMAVSICERLRLSAVEQKLVATIVAWHLEPLQMKSPGNLRPRHIRRYFAAVRPGGVETLLMALADSAASQGPRNTAKVQAELHERVRRMLAWHFSGAPSRCVPLLDGRQIASLLEVAPGPLIGRMLEGLADAQADGRVRTPEEAEQWVRATHSARSRVG